MIRLRKPVRVRELGLDLTILPIDELIAPDARDTDPIALARAAIELEPRNIDAFVQIARVYEKLDMADKAIESYRRAVGLDPTFYEPHQYFGVFYYGQGRYSEAANEFQRAIDLAPQFLNAYANLGAMYEKLGRTADAERVLRSALTLKKAPRLLANMGSLLLAEKRFAEARPYLQEAAVVMPNDYLVILNLADADRHLGYGAEARTNYRKGMELALAELSQSPRSWLPRAFVAYFAARLGSRRRAQDEIRQALRASPGNNTVIRRAVLTYEVLGMRTDAFAALGGATADVLRDLERDPDLADFCQDSRFKQLVEQISKK